MVKCSRLVPPRGLGPRPGLGAPARSVAGEHGVQEGLDGCCDFDERAPLEPVVFGDPLIDRCPS